MRILIWGTCFPKMGGVERFVDNLAKELARQGHDICVIGDGEETEAREQDGYHVLFFPTAAAQLNNDPLQLLEQAQKIRSHIANWKPDVIHFQRTGYALFLFAMVAKKGLPPYVITMHDECTVYETSAPIKIAHVQASALTAVSQYIAEQSSYPVPVQIITNALPAQAMPEAYPAGKRIFALGRQQEEKGFDTLIKAMAPVLIKHPDARLVLAGKGHQTSALKQLAKELDLAQAIDFPGWVHPNEVHQQMSEAAIIAMPSHWEEPFGLVALEAAWAARPCVATRVGGLQDIILDSPATPDSRTGLLVKPRDPQALSQAIISLLDDPARAEKIGQAAYRHAETTYSFDQMVSSYLKVFEEITATE